MYYWEMFYGLSDYFANHLICIFITNNEGQYDEDTA
jgi:hypothetical protein